jgi:ferredoxin
LNESCFVLQRGQFDRLIGEIRSRGYETIGPTVHDGSIVLAPIRGVDDLPAGCGAEQAPGSFRVGRREDGRLFEFAVGATSAKRWLFPPRRTLWRIKRNGNGVHFEPGEAEPPKTALIGLRSCDLQAINTQDRVFLQGPYVDSYYRAMRSRLLIVAVDCSEPAATCFCTSMGGGPGASDGFDLCLFELLDEKGHRFLIRPGSPIGEELIVALKLKPADRSDSKARTQAMKAAEQSISRRVDTEGIKELLYRNAEHPRWEQTASRCLSCGNCTLVCPTCFCWDMEDLTDLTGRDVSRDRVWDSCFNEAFSFVHGGSVRVSTMSRYRQWMTHKLAAWFDQFGTSGCVGCGRCITWCPVGIDITEEARAIRESELPVGGAIGG